MSAGPQARRSTAVEAAQALFLVADRALELGLLGRLHNPVDEGRVIRAALDRAEAARLLFRSAVIRGLVQRGIFLAEIGSDEQRVAFRVVLADMMALALKLELAARRGLRRDQ